METKINLSLRRRCEILDINRAFYYKWLEADYCYDDTKVKNEPCTIQDSQ